jgi:glutathione synthase/RimK-type ligase-like ATP-grasp enzyme
LLTNDIAELKKFTSKHGSELIAKSIRHGHLDGMNEQEIVFTKRISSDDLCSMQDNSSILPMLVQVEIRKKLDLRVTVVGDRLFCASFRSQEHAETSVDWRVSDIRPDLKLLSNEFSLPSTVGDMCRLVVKRFGLRFGCIDLILTPDDEYFFLELNPNGQWVWLEETLGFSIRDAIIDELSISGQPHV